MKPLPGLRSESLFPHDTHIGIIGRGITVENCFTDVALILFSIMTDVGNSHQTQVITFEFECAELEPALVIWLNLLLLKSKQHQLFFSMFRLKREGIVWKATVAGEPYRKELERGQAVKSVLQKELSVKKVDYQWEARCVVDV